MSAAGAAGASNGTGQVAEVVRRFAKDGGQDTAAINRADTTYSQRQAAPPTESVLLRKEIERVSVYSKRMPWASSSFPRS